MKQIKIFFIIIFLSLIFNFKVFAVDYSKQENWAINSYLQTNADYDVFYIYPTLFKSDKPATFDWSVEKDREKTKNFSNGQTNIFNRKKVRIFAPFVRQADIVSIIGEINSDFATDFDYNKGLTKYGIQDTADALTYYLKHYNNGKPYILFGDSQGSIDLLNAMKKVDLGENFLAAYLIGLPNAKYEKLTFKNIKPAQSRNDLGVIITFNTQNKNVENRHFLTPNAYVINPLNWRTDEKYASRFLNTTSKFYDYKTKKFSRKHFLTGAKVDKKNGILLVNLPENSIYDAHAIMGKGVFHATEVYLFSNAITKNAADRLKAYKELHKSDADKYLNCELGDLVGEDVVRLKNSKFNVDYHSEDFKEEQINNFVQRCLNEGVKTQYQIDCCVRQKMYPEK
ncbi:MAG: DUF3089 domain-containing protein [Candidatus Gastranaerophilales bacterium]|nr:DUF3089 domain-containing protein [Candidatus Gastranaerophilales bacterium]